MSTAASVLITEIRRRLRDATDKSYDDNMLLDAINNGARIFSTTTGCNQAIHNFTSSGGDTSLVSSIALSNLTNELINVYGVEFQSVALYWAPRSEAVKWNPAVGTPVGWNVWGGTLYLDAIITTMSATYDVDVSYTYAAAALTSTSSNVDIPDKWMPAIKAYMRYYIHDYNRDDGLAAIAYQEFDSIRLVAATLNEAQMSGGGYA